MIGHKLVLNHNVDVMTNCPFEAFQSLSTDSSTAVQ